MIEAIPEVAQIKTDFYTELGKVAPGKTIFATNSSTKPICRSDWPSKIIPGFTLSLMKSGKTIRQKS
ncbi:hypothetical protein QFZ73_001663 [Peribacillus sp. V2I11]|nr:hypothetical protein [Peribacillus sp. V2I11]